jgi:hypothetical protein
MASHLHTLSISPFTISNSPHNIQAYADETWFLNKEKKRKYVKQLKRIKEKQVVTIRSVKFINLLI